MTKDERLVSSWVKQSILNLQDVAARLWALANALDKAKDYELWGDIKNVVDALESGQPAQKMKRVSLSDTAKWIQENANQRIMVDGPCQTPVENEKSMRGMARDCLGMGAYLAVTFTDERDRPSNISKFYDSFEDLNDFKDRLLCQAYEVLGFWSSEAKKRAMDCGFGSYSGKRSL